MKMEKVLLSIVALSGLCGLSSPARRRFYFVYDPKNMTEAQSYCREKYTDLATIENMEDVNTLNRMVDINILSYKKHMNILDNMLVWTGLYRGPDRWGWSLSDTSFYKHGEMEFRRWRNGEPNIKDEQLCMQMNSTDGLWEHFNCGNRSKAVCMDIRGPNVKFLFINISMTWTKAQSYCRERYTDLVSVRNTVDNDIVQELAHPDNVWIGLVSSPWRWSDGSNSSFTYWKDGQPDSFSYEGCVVSDFQYSGRWEDWFCNIKVASICYSLVTEKKVIKLSLLKKHSSLDLNDPAVMESILKQVKQRLKNQGVNDNIKLSWKKQPDGKVFHKEKKKYKKDEF